MASVAERDIAKMMDVFGISRDEAERRYDEALVTKQRALFFASAGKSFELVHVDGLDVGVLKAPVSEETKISFADYGASQDIPMLFVEDGEPSFLHAPEWHSSWEYDDVVDFINRIMSRAGRGSANLKLE